MFICKVLWYAQSKKAQVQILLVLYLLIAEDGFSAPLLFKNLACSCENIMLNTAIISGDWCRTQREDSCWGSHYSEQSEKGKEITGIIFKVRGNYICYYKLYIHSVYICVYIYTYVCMCVYREIYVSNPPVL